MTLESSRKLELRTPQAISLFLSYIATSNSTELERLLSFPLIHFAEYNYEVPPIHICAASKNVHILEFLLKNGFDVNVPDISCNGGTILHRAAIDGAEEVARIALRHGVSINAIDNAGNTALHQAIYYEHIDLVRLILKSSPDLGILNSEQHAPYHVAVAKRLTEIINLFPPVKCDWYKTKQHREETIRTNLLFNPEDLTTKLKKPKAAKKSKKAGDKKGKK